jgi:uncharacterized protein
MVQTCRVLLLPGWLDSGAEHWQTLWERQLGWHRVQQSDWLWPRRGDWMARLDEVLLEADTPAVLAAHSLGCQLVAAWAAHSKHTSRVRGALLVAPPDVEREGGPPQIATWRPIVRQRLPFPTLVVYSEDDPYAAVDRVLDMATDWGSTARSAGRRGHLNGESGLADWPEAQSWLAELAAPAPLA